MSDPDNPFHPGELLAQARTGANDVAQWAAGFIRPFMPDQHREFFAQLPFLVLAGSDDAGRHWVTLLDGPDGFISSPDARSLAIDTVADPTDPLSGTLTGGGGVGLLGIELSTRRRNRMNGNVRTGGSILTIDVAQSFGNCPQYIHERKWRRSSSSKPGRAVRATQLSDQQIALIQTSDTMFIGTGQSQRGDHPSNGFDASHRGGDPGFVAVVDADHLRIPDYAGNNFFNTIGNLLENPRIGLVFVDFETGGLLHISGTATIDWEAYDSHDSQALRMIDVAIDAVIERPTALSLRWSKDDAELRELVVTDKIVESEDIVSFHLTGADGDALAPFEAGQHLPVELKIPGQSLRVKRSYSLSGAPGSDTYRLSIKREANGLASRFLHDEVSVGDRIYARPPSGDFVVPCSNCPLVLISAGVGLTPMLSILHDVALTDHRPVWYVHSARNGAAHAHQSEVAEIVDGNPNLRSVTHYSQPDERDDENKAYNAAGRIDVQTLIDLNAGDEAHYMMCGPAAFLADIRQGLEASGVPPQQIHFETFGPTG